MIELILLNFASIPVLMEILCVIFAYLCNASILQSNASSEVLELRRWTKQ